jgi:hypothetical protein
MFEEIADKIKPMENPKSVEPNYVVIGKMNI